MRSIPLDVWAAALLAAGVFLVSIFDPIAVIFTGVFFSVCTYVAVEAFGSKSS
jgi:hypothetical protein